MEKDELHEQRHHGEVFSAALVLYEKNSRFDTNFAILNRAFLDQFSWRFQDSTVLD